MDPREEGTEPTSDEQLLAAFLAGHESGFSTLVERYGREIYQFVARFLRNSASAEDIVQDTFIQVYQSASGFDPSRRFRPWLFTIAANKARDHLRSRVRKREVSLTTGTPSSGSEDATFLDFLSEPSPAQSDALEIAERREVVRSIVSQMPDHLREVLVLGYYHRFAYKDIAGVLSIPLGTVKSRLHAAVSFFAEAYRKVEGESDARRK